MPSQMQIQSPCDTRTLRRFLVAAVLAVIAFFALTLYLAMPVIHRAALARRLAWAGGGLGGDWHVGRYPVILKGQEVELSIPPFFDLSADDIDQLEGLRLSSLMVVDGGIAPENLALLSRMTEPGTEFHVQLAGSGVTDEHLSALTHWGRLSSLMLYHTGITARGYRHIAKLNHLTNLMVHPAQSLDSGAIAQFNTLQSLESVELTLTAPADPGLAEIGKLEQLTSLDARAAALADADLLYLFGRRIIHLSLSGSKVTDAGMATIAQFKDLEYLGLAQTAITDAGLAHLSGLEKLSYLDLTGTAVTDAGLVHLAKLSRLNSLELPAAVTQAGVEKAFADRAAPIHISGPGITSWPLPGKPK